MSAGSLENGEFCHAEVSTDGGASWIAVLTLGNGQDNGSPHTASASPAGIDNNPQVLLRLRGSGATTGDYCYGHSVVVNGTWGAATEPDIVVPASLGFGSVAVGGSGSLVATVDNAGNEIGRAHVCTPVTNAHLVCRLMLEKKNIKLL